MDLFFAADCWPIAWLQKPACVPLHFNKIFSIHWREVRFITSVPPADKILAGLINPQSHWCLACLISFHVFCWYWYSGFKKPISMPQQITDCQCWLHTSDAWSSIMLSSSFITNSQMAHWGESRTRTRFCQNKCMCIKKTSYIFTPLPHLSLIWIFRSHIYCQQLVVSLFTLSKLKKKNPHWS